MVRPTRTRSGCTWSTPLRRPARRGAGLITQISYVFPAGAARRPDTASSCPAGILHDERPGRAPQWDLAGGAAVRGRPETDGDDGGRCGQSRRDQTPRGAERDHVRALGAGTVEDAVAEPGRRRRPDVGEGERGGGDAERVDVGAAAVAALEMGLEGALVLGVEGVERVSRRKLVEVLGHRAT